MKGKGVAAAQKQKSIFKKLILLFCALCSVSSCFRSSVQNFRFRLCWVIIVSSFPEYVAVGLP